jgi:hypothetical protein
MAASLLSASDWSEAEATLFVVATVAKPVLKSGGAAAIAPALQIVSIAQGMSLKGVLLLRVATVAVGMLAPVLAVQPEQLDAALSVVRASLGVHMDCMMPWGDQQDHVGAVAFWRVATACPLQLVSSLPSLLEAQHSPTIRANLNAQGLRLILQANCAVCCAVPDEAARLSVVHSLLSPCVSALQAAASAAEPTAALDAIADLGCVASELGHAMPTIVSAAIEAAWPVIVVRCAFSTEIYTRRCHWFPRMFA